MTRMRRRSFVQGTGAAATIGVLDWLGWFRSFGIPGTGKTLGMAQAVAQAAATPHFLVYWFQEGGWDSYSMFGAVNTPNHGSVTFAPGTLNPTPPWSQQFYRPVQYGLDGTHYASKTTPVPGGGSITHGFLAEDGASLFPDMAVLSSHDGSTFHSGSRLDYHYGKYTKSLVPSAKRATNERSVMQAFCEAYGQSYALPHISWHRWLSDGELSEASYAPGTGYADALGPSYAHTTYGRTPADMRNRLSSLSGIAAGAKSVAIRKFVDNLHSNFVKDHQSESVKAFDSAVKIHKSLTGGTKVAVDPAKMFTDYRAEFGVTTADEATTSRSINGNPARSKDSPNTNVQAMMAYEMMTKGLSIGFWIENRTVRGFDTHGLRKQILSWKGQSNQLAMMRSDLWTPLKVFAAKLKSTQYGTSGKSYWDFTTIVLASEMGRSIQGNVADILASTDPDDVKYAAILEQDVSAHWKANSAAFLGGTVKGGTQFGRVGTSSLTGIPVDVNTGALDPSYDPVTGAKKAGAVANPAAAIPDAGHIYSTALYLSGLDPVALKAADKGQNSRPPLKFIKKSV